VVESIPTSIRDRRIMVLDDEKIAAAGVAKLRNATSKYSPAIARRTDVTPHRGLKLRKFREQVQLRFRYRETRFPDCQRSVGHSRQQGEQVAHCIGVSKIGVRGIANPEDVSVLAVESLKPR
jgi:hypothetical protein